MESEAWYEESFDPADLLPFSCRLLPNDPNVEKIPKAYKGALDKGVFDDRVSPLSKSA